MSEHEEPQREVVRFYTSTRNFPHLVGKLPSGEKIPGGPYTFAQIGWLVATFFVVSLLRDLWVTDNGLFNLAVMFGLPVAVGFLAGRLPWNIRNPWHLIRALPGAWTASRGHYRGEDIRIKKPKKVTQHALLEFDTDAEEQWVSSDFRLVEESQKHSFELSVEEECSPNQAAQHRAKVEQELAQRAPMSSVQSLLSAAAQGS